MADSPTPNVKQTPTKGTGTVDLKRSLFSSPSASFGTRKSMAFAYCFTFVFVACTIVVFFNNPSNNHSSIWFTNILKTRSQFSTIFSHFFPNATSTSASLSYPRDFIGRSQILRFPFSREEDGFSGNGNFSSSISKPSSPSTSEAPESPYAEFYGFSGKTNNSFNVSNKTSNSVQKTKAFENQVLSSNGQIEVYSTGQTSSFPSVKAGGTGGSLGENIMVNSLSESVKNVSSERVVNGTKMASSSPQSSTNSNAMEGVRETNANRTSKPSERTTVVSMAKQRKENWVERLSHCNIFDGTWVADNSYPVYSAGSCPHIDEPFDCFLNGRPDNGYENFRWQPKDCDISKLNGRDMLKLLRGKRLVYVGDSLNRNMWESMVCTLRSSVEDKNKVFEASGRQEFRTEGSYSFLFTDYNCSVEFFRSTFLVQEWEMPDANGSKKETLRLDQIEKSFDRFKDADILVFNTGHWWTHEKTSQGKGYYQEGSHVYDELNVIEAFRKAMTTWGRWMDSNTNPLKTLVFFRGYSASHFSGGQWNSGGQCDSETEPIKNEKYLAQYPPIMSMLEKVMKGMKTPVLYLNVTRMTDFRKDAHPSVYRKQNLTEEERRSPLRFQDCSHWCLPGVPDTWNELLYAQLLMKYNQKQLQEQQQQIRH